jgi:hypothetical protein
MFRRDEARAAGFFDLLSEAVAGLFPVPVLEALIARLEDRR